MGELLGFTIIVPFIMLLICAVIASAQVTLASQRLTYSAYSAGRAAVVAESEELAKERAKAVLSELYGDNFKTLVFLDNAIDPTTAGDSAFNLGYSLQDHEVGCTITYVGENSGWLKGDVIKCTIYQKITPLMPFTSGVRSQSVVMMIENGELKNPFFN